MGAASPVAGEARWRLRDADAAVRYAPYSASACPVYDHACKNVTPDAPSISVFMRRSHRKASVFAVAHVVPACAAADDQWCVPIMSCLRLHHAAPPGGLAPLYPLLAPRLRALDLELERILPPSRCQADLSGVQS